MTASQARAYVAKAEEYLLAATSELAAGRYVAATSLAIHAGINGADAVAAMRVGQRAAGQDHDEAIELLRTAGADGTAVARDLARLLSLQALAEYEPEDVSKSEATKAVVRARRIVEMAIRIAAAKRTVGPT